MVAVEAELVGGECPYWACIPSKMMIRAGNLLAEARRVPGMAGDSQVTPDFAPVAARIRDEATDDWNDQVAVDRFTRKGGRFVRGRALLTGPGRVEAEGEMFAVRRAVVLATGSRPQIPPVPGLEGVPYWTNRQAVSVKEPPTSLLVLGGGAIGMELAQAFARFGTAMTVVEAMERLLPTEEPEAGALLAEVLAEEGITIRTAARATAVRHVDHALRLTLDSGQEIAGQHLLVATGRRPQLAGQALPRVTFTDPEVGSVGLTEHAARVQGLRVRTGTARVPSSARGWIHKAGNQGLVKLVEDTGRGVLAGATSAGPAGGEVLFGLALAVQNEIPVERLRHMIFAYPTFHRAVEDALTDLGHH
ncbi:dihydrolipoyl dehydrogenase family protein [Streptomyces sp. NPDC090026]|uniref:dihydrolipoyl dehydrogenase family protein n=1 Tax=Streptomyces sp. NPDC090026 TaxID=3365923 RepID=UPI0037F9F774